MLKYVIAIGVAAGVAIPALAAKEYFVVRGPDEKCKVVETSLTEKTLVIVGDKAYVRREPAEARSRSSAKKRRSEGPQSPPIRRAFPLNGGSVIRSPRGV